jgi:hypothetical protein
VAPPFRGARDRGLPTSRNAILGSCVTRDIVRFVPDEFELASYHCRTSFPSLVSPPLDIGDDDLRCDSSFGKRMIFADFRKTFFHALEDAAPHHLIIDLVDERYDLMRAGDSVVTRSWDLVDSGVDDYDRYSFELVKRTRPSTHAFWRSSCDAFLTLMRRRFPEVRLVLHKAYWVRHHHHVERCGRFPTCERGGTCESRLRTAC